MSIRKNKRHIRKLKCEQNLQKVNSGMTNKQMKRFSNSLVVKEIPTETIIDSISSLSNDSRFKRLKIQRIGRM